jgi:hypothetical protein
MEPQDKRQTRHILPTIKETGESKVSPSNSTLIDVRELLDRYSQEVECSNLSQSSKSLYIDFANCFVHWMHGGFHPGMRKPGKPRSNIVR